jgi:hypothetical protein
LSCAAAGGNVEGAMIPTILFFLVSQIAATTDDGRRAWLHADGTWTWVEADESDDADRDNPLATAESDIVAHCAKRWSEDFQMVEFCRSQGREAVAKLKRWLADETVPRGVRERIFDGCRKRWGDDWQMTEFCTSQQTEAWRNLRN